MARLLAPQGPKQAQRCPESNRHRAHAAAYLPHGRRPLAAARRPAPQNSNLVLTAEQRTSAGREPDGSAETLWGKMKGRMGDRVTRERPEGLAGKKPKKREAGGEEGFDMPKRKKVRGGGTGLGRGVATASAGAAPQRAAK